MNHKNGTVQVKQMDKETENRQFIYEIKDNSINITGFHGTAARILLPAQIEGHPVAAVDRKAFLSQKSLYAVSFPDSIEEVGDWAFAHCDNLTELSFPRRQVRFGKAVFKNCGNLKRIEVRASGQEGQPRTDYMDPPKRLPDDPMEPTGQPLIALPASSELLAATVTMLDAYYLLDLQAAGSREWLEQWDAKLMSILRTPDQEGYISQSVYGEEDYIGMDLEEHMGRRRREKVRLAYLRLLHPQALPPALKQELEDYLRSLTKGQPGEEAWQVLKEEHAGDREYYRLFAELSCIREDNFEKILADIGEDNPEMKAFFLKHRENRRESAADFFESLEL